MKFVFGGHVLDVARRELWRGAMLVAIEPQVFDLLIYLIKNRDRMVSKDEILDAVWGGRIVSELALTTRINAARKAVGDNGAVQHLIRTLPRKGIRFVGEVRETHQPAVSVDPLPGIVAENPLKLAQALPYKPSIAVLPFANLSGDPEQEYFADGMVEEIVTALSRIRWLFVIARNSSSIFKGRSVDARQVGVELGVRYLLEGSVRRAVNRVRITIQLIDTTSGAHIWADHFDGSLEDIFDFQDKVAISVAGIIEPALEAAEICRSSQLSTVDLTAYDLYLRALPHWLSWQKDRTMHALDLLGQATGRDPGYGPALAASAWCHYVIDNNDWSQDPQTNRRLAMALARQALQVNAEEPGVIANAAFVLGYFGEDIEAAIRLVERSLLLNPSFAWGWVLHGFLHLYAGLPVAAIQHLETSLRLNPRDRRAFQLTGIGIAHFVSRNFDTALENSSIYCKNFRPLH